MPSPEVELGLVTAPPITTPENRLPDTNNPRGNSFDNTNPDDIFRNPDIEFVNHCVWPDCKDKPLPILGPNQAHDGGICKPCARKLIVKGIHYTHSSDSKKGELTKKEIREFDDRMKKEHRRTRKRESGYVEVITPGHWQRPTLVYLSREKSSA